METSDGRTEYAEDGRFRYRARQTIYGPQVPEAGLSFRVTVEGRWALDDRILTERIEQATVTPELGFASLQRLAKQMGDQARNQPPGVSDVVELSAPKLVLRDRDTGQVVSYRRASRQAAR